MKWNLMKQREKLDCFNHICKRMGAGLRPLLKNNKKVKAESVA